MAGDLEVTKEVALSFRDQLREARFKAQGDAEAFEEILFVVERIGCYLRKKQGDLGKYESYVVGLASRSPLFHFAPDACREMHIPFPILYDFVRKARNDAMHQGAVARSATDHAIELSLVLEEALMNSYDRVSDFMARNPICAAPWQPLSFVRRTMLANSFNCLPINLGSDVKPKWHLVSDKGVARYLRLRSNGVPLKDLLVQPLEEAAKGDGIKLELIQASTCRATDSVKKVLENCNGQAVLVTREKTDELLGIVTPYDLL